MTKAISRLQSISKTVWKLSAVSNMYVVLHESPIVIDTAPRSERKQLETWLGKVVDFASVKKVIFTHLHHDHIGNFDLFPNAKFFASEKEIEDFKKDPYAATLSEDMVRKFNEALHPLRSDDVFDVIETPGHTRGSVCLLYRKERILFSGDTFFGAKIIGRTDLPTSVPAAMQDSLMRLAEIKYRILCPGHDYE